MFAEEFEGHAELSSGALQLTSRLVLHVAREELISSSAPHAGVTTVRDVDKLLQFGGRGLGRFADGVAVRRLPVERAVWLNVLAMAPS